MLIRNLNKILLIGTVLLAGNADSNFATASMLPVEYATDPTTDQTLRSSERVLKNRPSRIPEEYKNVKEGLVIFKDGFKVFYGGPVTRGDNTIWTSPVVFERDELSVTMPKRVYELLFAMCIPTKPESVKGAELYYFEGKDIDLKFKNTLNSSYKNFTNLFDPSNKEQRVIIRRSDVAMVH